MGLTSGLTRGTQWVIADDLRLIPENNLETYHHDFDLPRRGWLSNFDTPTCLMWMETWRTLHPRRVIHAPGVISVQGDVLSGKPGIRVLRSGAKCSSDFVTAGLIFRVIFNTDLNKCKCISISFNHFHFYKCLCKHPVYQTQ